MRGVATARATAFYEARMAVRARVVWLAMVPLVLLGVVVAANSLTGAATARLNVGVMAQSLVLLIPIGAGVALADRFRRTGAAGLHELLDATPLSVAGRLAGALAGSLAVALAPTLALMAALGGYIAVLTGDATALLWVPPAFVLIVLPPCVWAVSFSATLSLLLPVAVSRVVLVAGWYWLIAWNYTLLWVPTPTGTLLSPAGEYPAASWFTASPTWAGYGQAGWLSPASGPVWSGLANIACVLGTAVLLLVCARLILIWKR